MIADFVIHMQSTVLVTNSSTSRLQHTTLVLLYPIFSAGKEMPRPATTFIKSMTCSCAEEDVSPDRRRLAATVIASFDVNIIDLGTN